jgi:phosphohistidine phosphatase
MDLILWRHADALEGREVEDDMARALSHKGERQAQRVAQWLNHVLPATTRVLVSPAVRAQQTAKALDRKFKTVPALSPEGSVSGLLDAARWPEAREPVLVVGHQPMLGLTAAYLLAGIEVDGANPWRIKKGGVWWLRCRERPDTGPEVMLVTVRSPDFL